MRIRLAQACDLVQLRAMSEAVAGAAHWTEQQWLDIFATETLHRDNPLRLAWIAEEGTGVDARGIGFLVVQSGGPDWELENIAVLPDCRRQKVGLGLISALLAEARARRAERILLEVRASSAGAIRFYHESGFQELARRCEYYLNPPEDALIMVHGL
jgi:ribosomal-protein-alanine N-acetyltransferase